MYAIHTQLDIYYIGNKLANSTLESVLGGNSPIQSIAKDGGASSRIYLHNSHLTVKITIFITA